MGRCEISMVFLLPFDVRHMTSVGALGGGAPEGGGTRGAAPPEGWVGGYSGAAPPEGWVYFE
ncbi:hypothetical protein VNDN105_35650 [Mycobacterium tuberculosis]|nr:hypothetical protein VNDN049_35620 [Mycobacterium tuberculosis]BCR66908.1 hypothetical protein VNDN105_35650 [Mycobacterium tuberculosis]